jgi:hypothetical protein
MKNTNTSRFRRFCYCAAEATSSCSLTCICDRESRSPEPSSSMILHRETANKVFGKRSSRLLTRFIKFFTTAHLPLHWLRIEGCRLQCELRQADRHLHPVIVVKELQVTYGSCSQIISYIFNMLIYVGMILLDNLLQCLLFIAMIDLSRTYGTAASLIWYALVMFMIYPWIKIKLKVFIFPTWISFMVLTLLSLEPTSRTAITIRWTSINSQLVNLRILWSNFTPRFMIDLFKKTLRKRWT